MGFSFKQFAEIGLKIAGPTLLGGVDLSGLLNKTKAKKHAHRDDPERGHDYVAVVIREALQAAYPAAIEALDRIAVVWATVALQEREEAEEAEEKPAPRRRKRRKKRAPAKKKKG